MTERSELKKKIKAITRTVVDSLSCSPFIKPREAEGCVTESGKGLSSWEVRYCYEPKGWDIDFLVEVTPDTLDATIEKQVRAGFHSQFKYWNINC